MALNLAYAGHDLVHDPSARLGLLAGGVGRLGRAPGVLGDLKHGGVHLLHGRGRLGDTLGLLLRSPVRLLDLGGQLLRGRGEHLDHAFQLRRGLEHALALGGFGLGLGLVGLFRGLAGLLSLRLGLQGLGFGLGDHAAQIVHHAPERFGEHADLVPVPDRQGFIQVPVGDLAGKGGGLNEGPGQGAGEEHRQTHHDQGDEP